MTQDTTTGIAIPEDMAAQVKDYVRQNFESGEPWSVTFERAIMAERERCANIAESLHSYPRVKLTWDEEGGRHEEPDGFGGPGSNIAAAIRTPTTGADHE